MRSAFHGQLLELPGVGVDNFSDLTCQAYLLSHCHTDHTAGLYSPSLLQHLRRGGVYVYMSQPSAAIVRHESGGGELMDYVRPLPIGTSTVAVRGTAWNGAPQAVAVTLLPAGHCWGSVMFLLRTPYHTLLYTGDCRLAENSVHKYAQLHREDGTVVQIDALYVDTTFGASPHRVLPSRSDSVARALSLIQRWLSGGGWGGAGGARGEDGAQRRVALHTSARYGYEFLFQRAQAALGQPVLVPRDVWPLYSQFPRQVRGVTDDPSATRVHLCRNRSHTKSHEACVGEHCAAHAYLYVHFSALKWTEYESGDDPVHVLQDGGAARLDVCFATHCSHTELQYLVRYLRPARVHGFPNQYEPAEPAERGDYLQDTNTVAGSRSDRSDDMSECRERDSKCDIEDKLVVKETLRKIFFDFDD